LSISNSVIRSTFILIRIFAFDPRRIQLVRYRLRHL
jgi:hypothetical protein